MKDAVFFSVVVPIYNAEKFLCQCLNSLKGQNYSNFEVIMVDDGSTDSSGDICDKYSHENSQFKVFHKKNGGEGSARNVGINNAKGKYIVFVDADDFLHENALKIIADNLINTQIDVLFYGLDFVDNEGKFLNHICWNDTNEGVPENGMSFLSRRRFMMYCIGGFVVKNALLKQFHIQFNENIKFSPDQIFILEVLTHSSEVVKIKDILYHYTQNVESVRYTQANANNFLVTMKAFIALKRQYLQLDIVIDNWLFSFFLKLCKMNFFTLAELKKLYVECNLRACKFRYRSEKRAFGLFNCNFYLGYIYYRLFCYYLKLINN